MHLPDYKIHLFQEKPGATRLSTIGVYLRAVKKEVVSNAQDYYFLGMMQPDGAF
ncbi:hypothetical protein SAMN05661012_06620 [Chitinophaga sancti]|uniref:Uncharacterized protein n=1 Tax=Chitinophaga sancti TaxID=1004 RepID=A0A1K1T1M2_9BACT|nr:hypothetical protein SAMN05661012_06620 [Chitinophaga sancti]